jgi:hypothetical protein
MEVDKEGKLVDDGGKLKVEDQVITNKPTNLLTNNQK